MSAPLFSLCGIKRVSLKPGESAIVKFTVTPEMMMLVNLNGESILESGKFKVAIGGSLPTSRSETLGSSKPVDATFTLK